ncbi:MAG: glycosyltransferase [Bacteroidota bacterium]
MSTVLYLSYDGMTDPLGRSQVLPYLIGLTKLGLKFHLVSFEKHEAFAKHAETVRTITQTNGIQWHPLTYTRKPPVISTIWDKSRMERMASKIIREHNVQAVHCRSYISGLVGMKLQKRFGIRFVFDIRGFWADERVEGGLWNLENPIYNTVYKYFKNQEKRMFAAADVIVSLTARGANIIQSDFNISKSKIHIIPCCADLEHFDHRNLNSDSIDELKIRAGIKNHQPVLGYLGAIGTWYMLDEMLEFYKRLLVRYPNAYFLLVTTEHQETILKAAENKGVPSSKIGVLSATREEVPAAISLFDVSVFFIRPTYSKSASSPTKQGELMGMGKPIICNAGIGDTDEVIRQYHCGDVIDLDDELSMDKAVAAFEQTKNLPKDQIRKGAEDFYSLQKGIEKYASIYRKLGLLN